MRGGNGARNGRKKMERGTVRALERGREEKGKGGRYVIQAYRGHVTLATPLFHKF